MPVNSKIGREHYLLFQEPLANERRNNKLRAEPESSLSKHILIYICCLKIIRVEVKLSLTKKFTFSNTLNSL